MGAILSPDLAAALAREVIDTAFEIVRKDRSGILQTVAMGAPVTAYDGYKMSWLEMAVGADGDTVNGAVLAAATTLVVDDGSKFRPGMSISVAGSDEVMIVTAVSGNNLTVTRGYGGTTAANIADNAVVTINGVAREENSLSAFDGIYQPVTMENYFQTTDTAIDFSRRALATAQWGNANDIAFQVSGRIRQLAIQMDRSLIKGRKGAFTLSGKTITTMGGMQYYTDQAGAIKVDNSGAALTLDQINAINAEIVARGGRANTVAVGIAKARKLHALVSAEYSSQRLGDWEADAGSILRLPSDLPLVGNVTNIVVDTNLNDNELYIYDSSMLSIVPMAAGNASVSGNWRTIDTTAVGQDGQSVRVIGDFSIIVRNSKSHMARLYNIG